MDEMFEVFTQDGVAAGLAPRSRCHGDPSLVHRAVHVIVFSTDGRTLLQRRSMAKDVQPGKWDTAVGGHLKPGESYEAAARREAAEELGLPESIPLAALFDLKIRNAVESEDVFVFATVSDGPFSAEPEEIDEIRFFNDGELLNLCASGAATPNCAVETERLLSDKPVYLALAHSKA